jgi:hypothetical protein
MPKETRIRDNPFQPVPFKRRRMAHFGICNWNGWSLKCYGVRLGTKDWRDFDGGWVLARRKLPVPASSSTRPGLGFLILHAGTADYVVLGWWDNENELPLSIFVRPGGRRRWRKRSAHESVCVWDLEIIWHERNAYVRHVMRAAPNSGRYLACFCGSRADGGDLTFVDVS